MGTQGNGSRVSAISGGEAAREWRACAFAKLSRFLSLLVIAIVLWTSAARAQTTNYTYDADGRVVAVTQNNGTTAQYTYDTLGHLAQTTTVASGQLAIFAFIPTHGEAGTQVTLEGQGFSASPASDSVAFNSTPATVISASATQIVTMVPAGATTGPISVSTGGNTAVSATPFIVDSTGLPPTITQVSPVTVGAGSTVTITGTNLDPVSGETVIQLGTTNVAVSSASNTQLQFVVPETATGGYVTILTPYGQAISAVPVAVLPSAVLPSNVVSSGNATVNGSGVNLTIGAGGQVGMVMFNGVSGSWLTLQVSGITTTASSIGYTIYGPRNTVVSQGTVSSTSPSIHLPQLTASGSYYATFQPSNAGAQLTVAVVTDAVLNGPLNMKAAAPWQSERVLFTATPNQNLELTLNGISVVGGSNPQFIVYVYTASGTQVVAPTCNVSNPGSSCQIHLWSMAAGTYTVTVVPNNGGIVGFNILLTSDMGMPALTIGNATTLSFVAGQVQRFTFNATAGQTVALNVAGTTTPMAANTGITFMVFRPDAGIITASSTPYTSFDTYNTSTVNLSNLPVSGTYTIIAAPDYGLAATGHLELVAGVTSNMTTNGASSGYAADVAGQDVYLSFTATQGENIELTFNNIHVTGQSTNCLTATVYTANGTVVANINSCGTSNPTGSWQQHLWDMAVGTYTVVVAPSGGGVLSFNTLLRDDVIGLTITPNNGVALNLAAGQVERFTFNGTVGQTLALNLSNITTAPADQGVTVSVYRPDAGTITGVTSAYASFDTVNNNTPTANLVNLPVSGIYTVIVSPDFGLPMTGELTLASGAAGALPVNGVAQTYTAGFTNQNAYLTFTAQAGENLELTFNNIAGSNSRGQTLQVAVDNATGQQVAFNNGCSESSDNASCIIHLWNMNAGTYTVTVQPNNSGTMSFNAQLQQDLVGPGLGASPVNVSLAAGQVEWLTFNATQGQTVALQLSGVTTTPFVNGAGVTFAVYTPNSGSISTGTGTYAAAHLTGAQVINLSSLPMTGTYTVIVAPDGGLPATAELNLVAGVTGTVTINGAHQSYASSASGQNAYLSFTAQAGANLELTLNNLTATGTGFQSVNVVVYSANGTQVGSMGVNSNDPAGSNLLHLWDLPEGTYSIVITPASGVNGGTMNFNIMLQPDVIEPTLSAGVPTQFSIGTGQVQRYTFNANAGDTVTLQFSQVIITPGGTDIWLPVTIYRPDVGVITNSTSTYSSNNVENGSLIITMSNLPVSGAYTVILGADYGLPATGDMYLTDTTGSGPIYTTPTLQSNGSIQSESASAAGQSVNMTFDATAGQYMQVSLSDIDVVGGATNGAEINVYTPSGSDIYGFVCQPNSIASCSASYYMPVSGTYTLVVSEPWSGTLNFNVQVEPWIAEPALTTNTPAAVNLSQGQAAEFTFTANAGDDVALSLSHISTSPSGQPVYMYVARPDQGPSLPVYASTTTTGGSGTLNLSSVPVTGIYTVVVYGEYGEPTTATLTLVPNNAVQLTENGSAQPISASGTGQNAYATFTANQGDNLELTLSNIAATNGSNFSADVTVYGPAGNEINNTGCNSSNPGNDCRLSLWDLAAGTYSIIVTPGSNVVMSFNMLLLTDVSEPALAPSTPTTVNLGVGQVERLTFSGTQGGTYALNLSGVSTSPGGQYFNVYIYRPDVGAISSGNYYTTTSINGSTTINLPNLPVSGNYTVLVETVDGEPGRLTLNLVPGATGQLTANTAAQSFATTVAGQDAYLTFTANPGDNDELTFSNITESQFNVAVYTQNGTSVSNSVTCSQSNPGSSCTTSLWNLAAGTYTVIVTGGPTSFSAQLDSDIIGPALSAGTLMNISLGEGQVERLMFSGTQGEPVALALSGISTTPAGQNLYLCVYRPDTGLPTPINCGNYYAEAVTSTGAIINLPSLPATGNYIVVIGQSNYGIPARAQLTLYANSYGALSTAGTVEAFSAAAAGENYYASFAANPGDNLELAFSNLSTNISVSVYDQNGKAVIANDGCGDAPDCLYSLWNLAGGTYQIVVDPPSGGTMSFNAQLTHDVVQSALAPNTTTAISLPVGNVQRYTFGGTLGQSVSLSLSSLVTTPSNYDMYVNVYRPDGGEIVSTPSNFATLSANSSSTISLPYLPASGTYTVIISTENGVPATAQLTYSVGASATLVSGGASQSFAISSTQNVGLSFTANANDNLELSLNNIIATGGNNGALAVTVYDPNGNTVTNFNCYSGNPGSSCNQSLWNLVAGTYTVTVAAMSNGTVQFDTQLQPDVMPGTLTANTPVQIGPNAAPSPTERFTFDANMGANETLQLSGVNTTPTGQPMTVSVYRPDVGTITTADAYQQFSTSGANALPLSNLPVSGTYTVIVNANGAVGSAAQLMLATQ